MLALATAPAAQAADPFLGGAPVSIRPGTQLLQFAYLGMKTGDPFSEVVLGGLSLHGLVPGGFLEQLYDLDAAPWFDTLAIHPYAVNVGTVIAHIQTARLIATQKGDANVPLRITEYGYATGGGSAWTTTAPCQTALIAATRELSARRAEFALRSIIQLQGRIAPGRRVRGPTMPACCTPTARRSRRSPPSPMRCMDWPRSPASAWPTSAPRSIRVDRGHTLRR